MFCVYAPNWLQSNEINCMPGMEERTRQQRRSRRQHLTVSSRRNVHGNTTVGPCQKVMEIRRNALAGQLLSPSVATKKTDHEERSDNAFTNVRNAKASCKQSSTGEQTCPGSPSRSSNS